MGKSRAFLSLRLVSVFSLLLVHEALSLGYTSPANPIPVSLTKVARSGGVEGSSHGGGGHGGRGGHGEGVEGRGGNNGGSSPPYGKAIPLVGGGALIPRTSTGHHKHNAASYSCSFSFAALFVAVGTLLLFCVHVC